MKTQSVIGRTLVLALAFLLTILVGCDNFMSSDEDFKKKLGDDVKVANAPKIQIRVQAESGTGTVSPNGLTTVKVDVPFNLLFQPSNEYGFLRWEAFSTGNTTRPLSGVVSFAEPGNPETMATLLVTRNDILIRPVCVERPRVSGTNPTSGRVDIVRNYPAKIYFSKEMDPSSFEFDDGTKRRDGKFKNIEISGLFGDPDTAEYESYERYFNEPELNVTQTGKTLTIRPMEGNLPRSFSVIRITVKKDVTDTNGLAMAQDVTFDYTLNNQEDKSPPVIDVDELKGGRTNSFEFAVDSSTHRITNEPVWLSVSASDAATGGGNVTSINVSQRMLYDSSGTAQPPAAPGNAVAYGFSPTEDNLNVMEFQHELGAVPDGIYELLIQATDSNQNITKIEDAVSYIVVRDTTAPAAQPEKMDHSGSTAAGWFNNAANKSITFTPTGTIVDQGVDASGTRPRTRSNTVQWQFRIGSTNAAVTAWSSAANDLQTVLSTQIEDGPAIPIQARLRDDLGNTSPYFNYGTIQKDSVAPAGTITINNTEVINGNDMIGNHAATVEVNAIDATSGRYQFIVRPDNTEPDLTDTWTDFPAIPTQRTTASVTFTDTEGEKTAYLWVRDKADNISTAVTVSAILDNTAPVIHTVYVKDEAWSSTSTEPSGTPGDQYSNDTNRFARFYIKASDAGSGVGSFSYSYLNGSAGTYSDWFPVTTNSSLQSSANGSVQNVHIANPAPGVVLIFGQFRMRDLDDLQRLAFKVRDRVERESAPASNSPTGNKLVLDRLSPVIDSVSVTDSGTGYYVDGDDDIYVKSPSQQINITARDQKDGAERVSGLKNATFTATDLTTVPAPITLSASPEAVGPLSGSRTVSLSPDDGLKNLSLVVDDWAGNTASQTVPVYLDTTAPRFAMSLAESGLSPFLEKPLDESSVILDASPLYSRKAIFDVSIMSATDALSGVAPGTVHSLTVYQKINTDLETVFTPLQNVAAVSATEVTIGPESAVYTVDVLLRDNVGNERPGRLGYHFDNRMPVITDAGTLDAFTVYNAADEEVGVEHNSRIFVPDVNVKFAISVTDKPGSDKPQPDPGGSGIASVKTMVKKGNTYQYGPVPIDETETHKYLKFNATSNVIPLSANEQNRITAGVTDKAGNTAWSHEPDVETSSYIVVPDTIEPSITAASVSGGTSYHNASNNRLYISTAELEVTATDPWTPLTGSGVTSWGLSTTDNAAGVSTWNTYSGVVSDTTFLRALLLANNPTPVYVFVRDRVGNVSSSYNLAETAGSLYLDEADPTITSLTVSRTDGITSRAGYTTTAGVDVQLTTRDTGAGIRSISFTGDVSSVDWTGLTGGTPVANRYTFTTPVTTTITQTIPVTLTSGEGENTVTATVTDAVGRTGTDNEPITLDSTDPVIIPAPAVAHFQGNSGYYVRSDVTAGFSQAPGTTDVDKWIVSDSDTAAYAAVNAGATYSGPTTIPSVSTHFSATLPRRLYAHVVDNAGNLGARELTTQAVKLDATNPILTSISLPEKTTDEDVNLTLNFTEEGSGVSKISITGVEHTTVPGWTSSYTGTTLTFTRTSLSDALLSHSALVIPITLTTGDGNKTVTVTVEDAVGNTSVTRTATTLMDTVPPVVSSFWIKRTDGKGTQNPVGTSDTYTTAANKAAIHVRFTEDGEGLDYIEFAAGEGLESLGDVTLTRGGSAYSVSYYTISGLRITFTGTGANRMFGNNTELVLNGVTLTSASDGVKTVTLTAAPDFGGGNPVSLPLATSITLDSTAPVKTGTSSLSPLITATTPWYVGPAVQATGLEATGTTGYAIVQSTNTTAPGAPASFSSYSGVTSVDVYNLLNTAQSRYLYVYFQDAAGNVSAGERVVANPVRIDNTTPTGFALGTLPAGAYYPGTGSTYYSQTGTITFSPSASDTLSLMGGYSTDPAGLSPAPAATVDVTGTASIYAFDRVGNRTGPIEVTVTADATPPDGLQLHASDGSLPAGAYWPGSGTMYYVNSSAAKTYTPYAEDSDTEIKGYSTTDTPSTATTISLAPPVTPGPVGVFAFNGVNNSVYQEFTFTVDSGIPDVTGMTLILPRYWHQDGEKLYYRTTAPDPEQYFHASGATDTGSDILGYSLTDSISAVESDLDIARSSGDVTIYAFDNVGNRTPKTYTRYYDNTAPDVNGFNFETPLPASYYYKPGTDGTTGTLYHKNTFTGVSLKPTGATDTATNDSGLRGYSVTNSFAAASNGDLTITDANKTVYVWDNIERNSTVVITLQLDNEAPAIDHVPGSGNFAESITGVQIRENGSGFATPDGVVVQQDSVSDFTSPRTLTWNGNDTVSDILPLNTNGNVDYIRFILTDNVGNVRTRIYERTRTGETAYTLVQESEAILSVQRLPRTTYTPDPRIPAQAGVGNTSYADPFAVDVGYTHQTPVAEPVSRTGETERASTISRTGTPASRRTGTPAEVSTSTAETVNVEDADDTVAVPQDASSIRAAALARSGMSLLQRRSGMRNEAVTTETIDKDPDTQQDSETPQSKTVSGDAEPASVPDGGTPGPTDNTPRRNADMPYCMPGKDSRRDEEEDDFQEV